MVPHSVYRNASLKFPLMHQLQDVRLPDFKHMGKEPMRIESFHYNVVTLDRLDHSLRGDPEMEIKIDPCDCKAIVAARKAKRNKPKEITAEDKEKAAEKEKAKKEGKESEKKEEEEEDSTVDDGVSNMFDDKECNCDDAYVEEDNEEDDDKKGEEEEDASEKAEKKKELEKKKKEEKDAEKKTEDKK